ncbi:hypothetical protein EI77_00081 [Prosthecobacter fusiformis]|uniref:Uncharacterized protein n=1 Tax=Prosthecobacter fusiformis TaxID=48464 RepID=A0A4R7SPE7_9BACT|nr:hypothetical protein [Prosthecobacter fusiformis]TDU80784.1 hypothetical protein EI77_00081 [Prosthecobacter fusiformis]
MSNATANLAAQVLEMLSEAGEEELIALYYLVFDDHVVSDARVKMLSYAVEYLARNGEVTMGLTRSVAKYMEYVAVPDKVQGCIISWLKVSAIDNCNTLELAKDVLISDLRPIIVDCR